MSQNSVENDERLEEQSSDFKRKNSAAQLMDNQLKKPRVADKQAEINQTDNVETESCANEKNMKTSLVSAETKRRSLDASGSDNEAEDLESASNDATSDRNNGGNWQCWSHEEEVFLVGAVLERFFSRGSLSSTKREANYSKHNCWEIIKQTYDQSWQKYAEAVSQSCPPERSENALSRHYKVMKERSISKLNRNSVDFKGFYEEWEAKYNKRFNLLPNDDSESDELFMSMSENNAFASKKAPCNLTAQSRGRWNYMDEVLLIGIVIETFFKRGSLSSSHKERMKDENDFWQNLHVVFEGVKDAINRDQGLSSGSTPSRTPQALARHFKVMKVKLIESRGKLNLKSFHKYWVQNYRKYYLQVDAGEEEMQSLQTPNGITSVPYGHPENLETHASKMRQNFESFQHQLTGSPNSVSSPTSSNFMQRLREMKPESNGVMNGFQGNLPGLRRIPSFVSFPATPSTQGTPNGLGPKNSFANLSRSFPGPLMHNVSSIDLTKLGDFISTPSMNTPFGSSFSQGTPSMLNNMMSPQPIVTTNGNATTYWVPLTFHNNENEGSGGEQSTGSNK